MDDDELEDSFNDKDQVDYSTSPPHHRMLGGELNKDAPVCGADTFNSYHIMGKDNSRTSCSEYHVFNPCRPDKHY